MTKKQMIEKLVSMAVAISGKNRGNATFDKVQEIWTLCCDWNMEHEDDEIFMCEHESEETGFVDGFYIEDDAYITAD